MDAQIVLPGDVYDTLEFAALVYGGVGGGLDFYSDDTPCCIHGLALEAAGGDGDVSQALYDACLTRQVNDTRAFDAAWPTVSPRIPFTEWCKRVNVVRGA